MTVAHGVRDDRGTLTRIAEMLYWLVLLDVLLVVCSAPTIVVWMLLAPTANNLPLYGASFVTVLPATSAALWAWHSRTEDPDAVPVARFLRGYRLTVLDSLKIGVPGLVTLSVLGTDIAYGQAVGTGALNTAFVLLAVMVATVMLRALSIASALTFRIVDVLRLSIFTLLTMPLRTLALLSLAVLAAGISLFVGDYAFLFLASALTFMLQRSEAPVIARLREQFVDVPDQHPMTTSKETP